MKQQHQQYLVLLFFTISTMGIISMALAEPEKKLSLRQQHIDLSLTVSQDTIIAFAPVIARISLTNRSDLPFALDVRKDGAPYALMFLSAQDGEDTFRHDQWICRSGPEKRKVVLAPGESTLGDVLIFFGPPTGFSFGDPGVYSVQVAFQPGQNQPSVYTNEVVLNVVENDLENRVFIEELTELAYQYFGYDREIFRRNNGERILAGYRLMQEILKVQGPHLVDPERNPKDVKEAELVDALSRLLAHYPNSSYSGYIARYLGLVHTKTFEHEISHRGAGSWGETKASPNHKEVTQLCQSEYEKALRYLTVASQTDLWPRTTASFHLARLHGMAEEWDEFSAVCNKLRKDHAESNGVQHADELERQMTKYKAKLARRKVDDP